MDVLYIAVWINPWNLFLLINMSSGQWEGIGTKRQNGKVYNITQQIHFHIKNYAGFQLSVTPD